MKYNRTRPRVRRSVAAAILVALSLAAWNCQGLLPRESWSRKWGPMVPHTAFPGDCGICHVSERWDVLREDFSFDHHAETGFELVGAHGRAACLRCHNDRGPVQVYVDRGCGGCHVDPHRGQLGVECTGCHNQQIWEPTGLIADHAATRFPLVASHALTACEACHTGAVRGDYRGAPAECHFCHQKEVLRASPNHGINGWIVGCEDCHTPADWDVVGFKHDFFPLLGGHSGLPCGQCHPNELFVAISPACVACHQNDYLAAPNHVAGNRSTDCMLCHNIFAWRAP